MDGLCPADAVLRHLDLLGTRNELVIVTVLI